MIELESPSTVQSGAARNGARSAHALPAHMASSTKRQTPMNK